MKHNLKILSPREMAYISLAAVLIAVCAWLVIPAAVPFTMQTFAVFLILDLLGAKRGMVCLLLYLGMGCIGLPVFSGGSGGIGVLLGNTGGYIIGWLFASLVALVFERFITGRLWMRMLSSVCGLCVCYAFGTVWFVVLYTAHIGDIGPAAALMMCVVPFIIPDILKIALALAISRRLKRIIKL